MTLSEHSKLHGSSKSNEHRAKISAAHKGLKHSDNVRKKISEAKKGKPSNRKGCKLTEEQKKKISDTVKAAKNRSIHVAMHK